MYQDRLWALQRLLLSLPTLFSLHFPSLDTCLTMYFMGESHSSNLWKREGSEDGLAVNCCGVHQSKAAPGIPQSISVVRSQDKVASADERKENQCVIKELMSPCWLFLVLLFSSGCSNSPEMTVLGQPWKCSYTLKSEQCPCGFPSLFLFKSPKSNLLSLQSWTPLRLWATLVLKSSEVTSILPRELPRQPGLMNKTGHKLDALKQFKKCCRSICAFFFPADPCLLLLDFD